MDGAASNPHPASTNRSRYPALLAGGVFGGLLMYLLDPLSGRRRRALLRDQLVHASRLAADGTRVTARDLSNRLYGLSAQAKRAMHRDRPSDEVLAARARARIGRLVSHPHSIGVSVSDGCVRLEGPILAHEVDGLLHAVQRTRGIRSVDDGLTVYPEPGDVPGLQGGYPRRGDRFELLQDNWSPAARVAVGAAGAMMMMRRNGGALGALGRVAGALLLTRSMTNRDLPSLFSAGEAARPIAVYKSIHIDAPVDRVFDFWADVENFPRFMSRVREVTPVSDSTLHWTVTGPAGMPVSWNAEITDFEPNDRIGWQTVPGSAVRHRGLVRFFRCNDSSTRVEVRLDYLPPAGALGHVAAMLFGADPKSTMDADLLRMKSAIESGRRPHDAWDRTPAPEISEGGLP